MARRRQRRPRWRRIHPTRLALLERALRGGDPEWIPHRAADELARTREGARLLARVIASPGPPELREAAVYGFYLATTTSPQLALVFRVCCDLREPPRLRGQAAEVLGSHLYKVKPWRRRYQRIMEALVRGLDDPAPVVRYWCIHAVGRPGNTGVLPKLHHIVDTDTAIGWGGISLKQEALDAIETIEPRDDADPAKTSGLPPPSCP